MQSQTSQSLQKFRLSMNHTCELLDISREGLRKLMISDPTFPRGFKSNPDSRQSKVFFDYSSILNWYENQKKINQIWFLNLGYFSPIELKYRSTQLQKLVNVCLVTRRSQIWKSVKRNILPDGIQPNHLNVPRHTVEWLGTETLLGKIQVSYVYPP